MLVARSDHAYRHTAGFRDVLPLPVWRLPVIGMCTIRGRAHVPRNDCPRHPPLPSLGYMFAQEIPHTKARYSYVLGARMLDRPWKWAGRSSCTWIAQRSTAAPSVGAMRPTMTTSSPRHVQREQQCASDRKFAHGPTWQRVMQDFRGRQGRAYLFNSVYVPPSPPPRTVSDRSVSQHQTVRCCKHFCPRGVLSGCLASCRGGMGLPPCRASSFEIFM